LKKAVSFLFIGLLGGLVSCNNYNTSNPYGNTVSTVPLNQIKFRAFVSNPVQPNGLAGGSPVLNVVDLSTNLLSPYTIPLASLSSNIDDAGMMALSPKRDRTLVVSPADDKVAIVSNPGNSVSSSVTLPGPTESLFVSADNVTAFAAVPTASMPGLAPGAVVRIDLATSSITATIPIPGAHFLATSENGNSILVFSDNSDSVTLITAALIGVNGQSNNAQASCTSTQTAACVIPGSFDRPVSAVFNTSGTTAYVLNCGEQCGGAGAGACPGFNACTTVTSLDMTHALPVQGASVAVPAATIGFLQGNSLYVAGTPALPSDNTCTGVTTAATTCGRLTVVNVATMAAATPVVITDGYHDRIAMGANAQLFIGSRNCTNVNLAGGEVRGCLSIVNTSAGSVSASDVVATSDNGDVTGIAPIPNGNLVYVCEGGKLRVYDTTTDKLAVLKNGPSITGEAIDVKVVGF
jgi:hypothetical protein